MQSCPARAAIQLRTLNIEHPTSSRITSTRRIGVLLVVGLLLLYGLGIGVRRFVLEAQFAAGTELPFTLESALLFRRIAMVFTGDGLPVRDTAVEYPGGGVVRETYEVGSEYVYAALARLLPGTMSLPDRLRWIEVGFFCLGIPFLALWLAWWLRSPLAGATGGLFYAVSLSSVMRSTGQELSLENSALPLLIMHLAFDALAARVSADGRRSLICMFASAIPLALAVMTWDLTRYYILLWAIWAFVRLSREGFPARVEWVVRWRVQCVALMACGALNPYLRHHLFLLSPEMLLAYGVAGLSFGGASLAGWCRARSGGRNTRVWPAAVALLGLLPLLAGWLGEGFMGAYGHFLELLMAKLRFLNEKPMDPSLLTFEQRIMWVPALHSASWALTWELFPAILFLTILGAAVVSYRPESLGSPSLNQLAFFFIASLLTFCLFARFHVFLAVFASAMAGVVAGWAQRRSRGQRSLAVGLLLVGLVVEAGQVLRQPERWGRKGVYYQETAELIDWFRSLNEPAPVLANFGISASILAYGDCPIVLHPKFESPGIRNRVREYGEALFTSTEEGFRAWALPFGPRYYVYALGEFSDAEPRHQMRYFVNALEPPPEAAARLFESRPAEGEHFHYLWGNRKYRIFRLFSLEDEARARGLAAEAAAALAAGEIERAERAAQAALEAYPRQEEALEILARVDAQRP